MSLRRQQAWRRGRRGEALAMLALRLAGYRILARNIRGGLGEIDIVAKRGAVIAFVEVKTRASIGSAADSLGGRQRRRIARAAATFLAARPHLADRQVRFDVILVAPWQWPRHITSAWRPDS